MPTKKAQNPTALDAAGALANILVGASAGMTLRNQFRSHHRRQERQANPNRLETLTKDFLKARKALAAARATAKRNPSLKDDLELLQETAARAADQHDSEAFFVAATQAAHTARELAQATGNKQEREAWEGVAAMWQDAADKPMRPNPFLRTSAARARLATTKPAPARNPYAKSDLERIARDFAERVRDGEIEKSDAIEYLQGYGLKKAAASKLLTDALGRRNPKPPKAAPRTARNPRGYAYSVLSDEKFEQACLKEIDFHKREIGDLEESIAYWKHQIAIGNAADVGWAKREIAQHQAGIARHIDAIQAEYALIDERLERNPRRPARAKNPRNPMPARNRAFAQMFHGHTVGQTREMVVSKRANGLGSHINKLGAAHYVKLLSRATGHHRNPRHACPACTIPMRNVELVANPRNSRLGFAGKGIFAVGRALRAQHRQANPHEAGPVILDLGEVDILQYATPEKQTPQGADAPLVSYYHQAGEESGLIADKPHLMVDEEGAIFLYGGNNTISERGIIN